MTSVRSLPAAAIFMLLLAAAGTWHSPTLLRAERGADSKTRDITFDDLKFPINKGEPFERKKLTKKIVEELNGSNVKIRGYMLPAFQQKGITQFVLVRDNLECCFGPGAALYDCIMVELKGTTTSFTVKPIAVEGLLKVDEFKDPDDNVLAVFRIDGTAVK